MNQRFAGILAFLSTFMIDNTRSGRRRYRWSPGVQQGSAFFEPQRSKSYYKRRRLGMCR